jgi:hypothetical protein
VRASRRLAQPHRHIGGGESPTHFVRICATVPEWLLVVNFHEVEDLSGQRAAGIR